MFLLDQTFYNLISIKFVDRQCLCISKLPIDWFGGSLIGKGSVRWCTTLPRSNKTTRKQVDSDIYFEFLSNHTMSVSRLITIYPFWNPITKQCHATVDIPPRTVCKACLSVCMYMVDEIKKKFVRCSVMRVCCSGLWISSHSWKCCCCCFSRVAAFWLRLNGRYPTKYSIINFMSHLTGRYHDQTFQNFKDHKAIERSMCLIFFLFVAYFFIDYRTPLSDKIFGRVRLPACGGQTLVSLSLPPPFPSSSFFHSLVLKKSLHD